MNKAAGAAAAERLGRSPKRGAAAPLVITTKLQSPCFEENRVNTEKTREIIGFSHDFGYFVFIYGGMVNLCKLRM